MSILLTKVLPIKLVLNKEGKKVPVGGLNYKNIKDSKDIKKNFAIYMQDYPNIIVLDLDIRDHKFKKYINKTYTHKTKKGWHLFFENTFNLKTKISNHKEKFDVLVGKNWCFYNYEDEEIAYYREYNTLPLAPFPQEIWEQIKPKPITMDTQGFEYKIQPLVSLIYERVIKSAKTKGSSEIAYNISLLTIGYSRDIEFHKSLLKYFIDKKVPINKKHLQNKYIERVINKIRDEKLKNERVNFRYLDEFRIVHSAKKQFYLDIINDEFVSKVYISDLLLDNVEIKLLNMFRIYEKVVFNPADERKFIGNTYNIFGGFIEIKSEGEGHIDFLNFVKEVICSDNEEYYNYMINYLAHLVQKTANRPDVAIVLSSPEKGIGKDTLHILVGKLLKNGGYINLTEEELFGRFKMRLKQMLIAVADELVYGGSHKEDSALKRFITRDTIPIEEKGAGTEEYDNYVRLFITSNADKPVKATQGERRYFILKPSSKYKNNISYWNNLYSNFDPHRLMYYLKFEVDISDFNIRNIPQTEELQELINLNKSILDEKLDEWWEKIKNGDFINFKDLFDELYIEDRFLTSRKLASKVFHKFGKEHFTPTSKDGSRGYRMIK